VASDAEAEPEAEEAAPSAFEAWNDYDPSMRFITAFPMTAAHGTTNSTIAYYEFEPGRHSGLHADNAEELIYVVDGEGEVFVSGRQERLEAGGFAFIGEGIQHDVYAYGDRPLRLLSFFPVARVESKFEEMLLPFADHVVSSDMPPAPQVQEITFDDLPPELAEDMMGYESPFFGPEAEAAAAEAAAEIAAEEAAEGAAQESAAEAAGEADAEAEPESAAETEAESKEQ
jgi:quercetin dioxygenase-like cupin family protein